MKVLGYLVILGISGIFTPAHTASTAPDARQIMIKNDEARKLRETIASASLKTAGGGKKDNDKTFTWWRKVQKDDKRFNTLTRFHSPPTIRGQGILFQEREGGENEIQLYLPTFKKIRRVENQEQSSSFMGSVFSYSDMTVLQVEDFSFKYLREEKCPADGKQDCFVVEQTPAKESIKERHGYGRWINWVRKDNFMMDQREYFDLGDKLLKRLTAKDTRMLDQKEKRWMSFYLRLEDVTSGRYSELVFSDVKANTGISDAMFTPQKLKQAD